MPKAAEPDLLELLDGVEEAVVVLDGARRVQRANRAARQLLGVEPGRLLVESLRAPTVHELLDKGAGADEFDLGEKRVLGRVARLGGGAVLVASDLTELRRLERIRRDFVTNVSHELRTPVSVIRLNAEALLDGALEDDPEEARPFVEAIGRSAERLTALLGDVLELARIESGRSALERVPIPVGPALERAAEGVRHLAEGKGLRLEVEPTEARVVADATALDSVLANLAENAVKYTPSGGRVTLRHREGRLEVEDDGPGIAPKHRERIFERFYRVDPGRSRDMGGTGLGLSITRNLVLLMGGQVGLEPVRPHGCIFWVRLPAA